ncbi:hypothetical protein [Spirosoma sp. KNUC1025]|uniref:hypothetical protein n=1 Tax=Spirosoma sp. KNUC1025 TaxID=2894082 RepID=UPI00386A900F|nr:hypothetical protein LN737_04525 [Spirosoma sp. KNUC1025]
MTLEQDKDTQIDVYINGNDFNQANFEQTNTLQSQANTAYKTPIVKTNTDNKEEAKRQLTNLLLGTEAEISEIAKGAIIQSPPLISRADTGIIGRNTINIIQGAYGSHKSRLAELLASLMLTSNKADDPQFLNFKRTMLERFCVCYIDTERNLTEELPIAVQGIKLKAGYQLEDKPSDFRFTSIKPVERGRRFDAIEAFVGHVRNNTPLHLFCLIDVVTDAIGDFNDPKESMKLFDFLGNLCDKHNATFLLVIHQNPGTEKARGHAGTEAANKASTALQIGYEKDASGNDTELIRLRYLKLRRGKRPEPLYLQFCQQSNGLVLADASTIATHVNSRKHKADSEDIADRLISLLSEGPLPKNEVWTILEAEFKAKNSTIRERLKGIMADSPDMYDEEGRAVKLADYTEGRNQFFKLVPME